MYHFPTKAVFEIVYDPDQAMVYDGQTMYGFAARIWHMFDEALLPTDSDQL
jgi:hypothetical protein